MRAWDSRLVVVSGKGGVGRTTAAIALGIAAARAGRYTCVVELYGTGSVPAAWGLEGRSYDPRPLRPGLDTLSLTPRECMDEFGRRKLRVGALVKLVFSNRITGAFLDAVPGMHDLLQLGKLEHMLITPDADEPAYDLVILDAPATGHGLTLMAATRSMMDMTRMGPFYELAATIDRLLSDPVRTSLALVSLPEELPVNETLEFVGALGPERAQVRALLVNQVREDALAGDPPWEVVRERLVGRSDPDLDVLVGLGDEVAHRQHHQRQAIERLQLGANELAGRRVPLGCMPRLPDQELGPEQLERLGDVLHDRLGDR